MRLRIRQSSASVVEGGQQLRRSADVEPLKIFNLAADEREALGEVRRVVIRGQGYAAKRRRSAEGPPKERMQRLS